MHLISVAEMYFSFFVTSSAFRSDDVFVSSHFRSDNNHSISNDDVNNAYIISHIVILIFFLSRDHSHSSHRRRALSDSDNLAFFYACQMIHKERKRFKRTSL